MQGWECPKCHKVYAPHVDECKHCNAEQHEEVTPYVPEPKPYTVPTAPYNPYIYRKTRNPFDPPITPTWLYDPNSPFNITCRSQ